MYLSSFSYQTSFFFVMRGETFFFFKIFIELHLLYNVV